MEFKIAQIVRSMAGHDKGELFCIVKIDGCYLFLADGKHRTLVAPKRKKQMHAAHAGAFGHPALDQLAQGQTVSDSEIRRALAAFRAQLRRV